MPKRRTSAKQSASTSRLMPCATAGCGALIYVPPGAGVRESVCPLCHRSHEIPAVTQPTLPRSKRPG